MGREGGQLLRLRCFILGETAPNIHRIGGLVGPRSRLNMLVRRKTPPLATRNRNPVVSLYPVTSLPELSQFINKVPTSRKRIRKCKEELRFWHY